MDGALVKELSLFGGAGLMFLAYYILHQSTFAVIKTLMDRSAQDFAQSLSQQTRAFESALQQMSDWSDRLAARQNAVDERNFKGMQDQLEALQVLVAAVSRVETKIDSLKGVRK